MSTVSKYRPAIRTRTGSTLEKAYAYLRVARTTRRSRPSARGRRRRRSRSPSRPVRPSPGPTFPLARIPRTEYTHLPPVGATVPRPPYADFARPGSALRAARKHNPRNLPCPTCKQPDRLTPADVRRGYQCDDCADRDEGRGW